jgi:release factor glutamine methyltransferase
MTLKEFFAEVIGAYPHLQNQKRDIENLVASCTGLSWSSIQLASDRTLSKEESQILLAQVQRLAVGEPCAYITGSQFFYENEFLVRPGVLIPRPETELIVEVALQISCPPKRVADLGAGSGCIGLSLAKAWPLAEVCLFDSSDQALALCRANIEHLGVQNVSVEKRVISRENTEPTQEFELIVANPPYIALDDTRVENSVREFEPPEALFAGDKGMAQIEEWLHWSEQNLTPGGHFIFEFGQGQSEAIRVLVGSTAFRVVEVVNDYQKIPRIFHLEKPKRL